MVAAVGCVPYRSYFHRTATGGTNHMHYIVRFVADAALPIGTAWAFARLSGATYLFVKESAIDVETGTCQALSDAWECWQDAQRQDAERMLGRFARAL